MASITTFFGTQGGGGSVSGTATRVAFFGGTPGNPSTTLDDSASLEWDDTNSRLSVGDAATVGSTVTIAGAGASALVVTNSLCTTASLVFAEVRTNDATATIKNVVPAGGSFTINLGAAATAETSVGFFIIN